MGGICTQFLCAKRIEPIKFEWPQKYLTQKTYQEIVNTLEIGDMIVCFRSNQFQSKGPEFFTKSNAAHTIEIFGIEKKKNEKNEDVKIIKTIESTVLNSGPKCCLYAELAFSCISGVNRCPSLDYYNGVQYNCLDERIKEFDIVWVVKLNDVAKKVLNDNMSTLLLWDTIKEVANDPYDAFGAVTSVFKDWPILHQLFEINDNVRKRPEETFFCSGFIAAGYCACNIIQVPNFKWQLCDPAEFLRFNIWNPNIVQIKGINPKYSDLYAPVDFNRFNNITPENWQKEMEQALNWCKYSYKKN